MCTQIGNHPWPLISTSVSKVNDFSRFRAGTHTVKVVVSRRGCKINTLLWQTINRKCHVAYWILPFSIALNDPEDIHLLQGFSTAIPGTFVHHFIGFQMTRTTATATLCECWVYVVKLQLRKELPGWDCKHQQNTPEISSFSSTKAANTSLLSQYLRNVNSIFRTQQLASFPETVKWCNDNTRLQVVEYLK